MGGRFQAENGRCAVTLHTVTCHGTTADFRTFAGSENGQPCRASFELKGDDQVMAAYGLYAFVKGASNSADDLEKINGFISRLYESKKGTFNGTRFQPGKPGPNGLVLSAVALP